MVKFNILTLILLGVLIGGCESEAQKRSAKSFEKILTEKKKFEKIKQDEPTVSEQLTREIYSQTDTRKEKEKGLFQFGSK